MIHVLVTGARDYTLTAWLASQRALGLRARVRPLHYESLERSPALPPGTYVFTDLERLGAARLELARRLWDHLAAHPRRYRLLNDPRVALRRYELLRELHAAGRNRFRALRASESLADLRYPVFVREERDHTGSLTGLLHDRGALEAELRRLGSRVRTGLHVRGLLVVEFADTSGGSGWHVKYSAFRVGDRILPRYRVASRHWMVKADGRATDPAELQAEADYIDTDPHAAWLRETFALAGIDYGRIDYGVVDGDPQVWEINTNPTIGARLRHGRRAFQTRAASHPVHERSRSRFHEGFRQALEEIDMELAGHDAPNRSPAPPPFQVPRALVRGARRERLAETLARRYRGWLRKPAGYTARVAAIALTTWVATLGLDAATGEVRAASALAELALLVPLTAALGYCALRAALSPLGRALAVAVAALGVPLVEVLGTVVLATEGGTGGAFTTSLFTMGTLSALPAPVAAQLPRLAVRAALLAALLAVVLRGRGAHRDAPRDAHAGDEFAVRTWSRHLGLAVAIGAATGAGLLFASVSAPFGAAGTLLWLLARGPLLLLAVAPLLATNRPGRWTPAWAFAAAMALLTALARPPDAAYASAPVAVAVIIAIAGNALLGAALGLSIDPLVPRRWNRWWKRWGKRRTNGRDSDPARAARRD